ncbi:alpha/beta hydrolase family esterase [Corynebacterium lubricantis]|uniref:alpha/beta hydrolase family esterase n=1 Tax=Corynebacterium lubricantis TaxID=541095 RepID=UPI00036EA89E|nr:PHB depolymerase family esterase [Corynebacterium lubricantis]
MGHWGLRVGAVSAALTCAIVASACTPGSVSDQALGGALNFGQQVPSGLQRQSLNVEGEHRSYLISVPEGDSPKPVIYVFHGWGLNAATIAEDTDFHEADAIVVYPEGSNNAWAPAYYADDPSGRSDLFFMDAVHEDVKATYSVAEDRVYAAGFSNGGGFARYLSCQRPGLIDSIATVGGAFFDTTVSECAAEPTPFLNIHGTSDPTVAYGGRIHMNDGVPYTYLGVSQVLDHATTRNNCSTDREEKRESETVTLVDYSDCEGYPIEHLRVSGLSHFWPRGELDSGGVDATERTLTFFGL